MLRQGLLPVIAAALLGSLLFGCDPREQPVKPKAGAEAPEQRAAAGAAGRTDRPFVEQAVASGLAELELSKRLLSSASSTERKKLAERLYQDRSRVNQALMRIVAAKGLGLSTPEAAHLEADGVRPLPGADLDRAVLEQLARSHRGSIALFEQAENDGADPAVKAFAAKTLPTLREHLKLVEDELARTATVDPPAGPKAFVSA
jgi:putative membrane protein